MNKLKRTLVAGLILAGAIALGVVAPNMIILPAVAAVAATFLMAADVSHGRYRVEQPSDGAPARASR
jgi:hypothetical protein